MRERLRRALRGEGFFPGNGWQSAVVIGVVTSLTGLAFVQRGLPWVSCAACIAGTDPWYYCYIVTACCFFFDCP